MTGRSRTLALVLTLAFALPALAGLTGCAGDKGGGDDVASAGDGDNRNAAAPAEEDISEKMRQFAACMREQGIDMPDPEVEGDGEGRFRVRMPGGEGGEPPDREKVDEARKKCQHLLPNGGEMGEPDAEDVERAREHAKCMRENGVPNFPDPSADGRITIGPDQGIDPRDPAFQEAQKKCEGLAPGGGRRVNSGGDR